MDGTIGIDRIKLDNIQVIDILDINDLDRRSNITSYGGEKYCLRKLPETYVQGKRIIDDDRFNEFKFYTSEKTLAGHCTLDFSATHLYGINFDNMSLQETIWTAESIRDYLAAEYGIITDFSRAKITYVEINVTFATDAEFRYYERPVKIIMAELPRRFKQISVFGKAPKCLHYSTYAKGNQRETFIIYDKRAEILEKLGGDIGYHCIRAEIRLKEAQKVQESLGTNELYQLKEQSIQKFFITECNVCVGRQIEKWAADNQTKLIKQAKEWKKRDATRWLPNFLASLSDAENQTNVPALLDIEIINDLITSGKIKSAQPARLKRTIIKKQEIHAVFFHEGRRRLIHILHHIFIDTSGFF